MDRAKRAGTQWSSLVGDYQPSTAPTEEAAGHLVVAAERSCWRTTWRHSFGSRRTVHTDRVRLDHWAELLRPVAFQASEASKARASVVGTRAFAAVSTRHRRIHLHHRHVLHLGPFRDHAVAGG